MGKIRKLSIFEAQQIAAGEVVERPANVVKELLENSIDAGATTIALSIEDGGHKLIRCVDNGSGMDREDAYLCIEHHATSKFTEINSINQLTTFGFRGEALSSIAAVSKMSMITKTAQAQTGLQLEVVDGKISAELSCSAPVGTELAVRDIFYALPARLKFVRKKETEFRAITTVFTALALANTAVTFSLYNEGKMYLHCPAVEAFADRVAQVYGARFGEHMLVGKASGVIQELVVSDLSYTCYDRSSIMILVNGRWVKNHPLVSAVVKGYRAMLVAGKYPAGVVALQLEGGDVDINVHPRKEEVTFLHPRLVEQAIERAVVETLEGWVHGSQRFEAVPVQNHQQASANVWYRAPAQGTTSFAPRQQPSATEVSLAQTSPVIATTIPTSPWMETITWEQPQQTVENTKNYRIVGQVFSTYILLERVHELVLLDQHAVAERVLYERFKTRIEQGQVAQLAVPLFVDLDEYRVTLLEAKLSLLEHVGLVCERFSQTRLVIRALPLALKRVNLDELFAQVADLVAGQCSLAEVQEKLYHNLCALMACKAAIKAGDLLGQEEIERLVSDWYGLADEITCPHGRPTCWVMSKYEIEKSVRRIV